MRARKSLGKWLAAALVAAAGVVLSGCPHNNLIDGGGAGGPAGGSRGGNGEVKLIVTNFAADSGGGRSSSWLAPSRTIAPDHIDLKAEKDKYVFVAEGTSNGGEAYGPEYITLEDDGSTSLGIAGGGIWTVTVSAYEATKLNGLGVGTTPTDIMQGKTAKEVKDSGDTALVLQGKATLDLGMNSTGSVTVTLTNDGVGIEGNVNVTLNFDAGDVTKINEDANNKYSVKVGLYDYNTNQLVQKTGGGDAEDEIKPRGVELTDPEVTSITNVPKGRYQFRVTVTEVASGKAVAYWVDDIYVEGNRDTKKEVDVSKLFDTPEKPTKAGVYWSRKDSGEAREGFLAYLSWEDMPFNAVGVDVQIADITKWYKTTGADDKVNFGAGDQDITTATDLWTKIDALPKAGAGGAGVQPTFEQVVTELKWSDFPQKATGYPIYKKGSLLNGYPGIVLLMQTGHVYTVRIRAAGGNDSSDWLPIDQTSSAAMTEPVVIPNVPPAVPPAGGTQKASKFNDDKLRKGIFDLVMLKYSLQDKYELAKTNAGLTKGDKATENDLVVYKPYGEAITIDLKYTNMATPVQGDWFLYPLGAVPPADINGRDKGWKGWKGVEDPTKEFKATAWGSYDGHKDLTLVPVGAGAGANIQANTADTFNVLTEDTVLVTLEADGNAAATAGFLELVNGDTNPNGGGGADVKTTGLGIQKDPVGNRYILNMDDAAKNKTAGNATWLYVSVGEDPARPGTLNDKNGNEFTVQDIQVRILERGLITAKTFIKASSSVAYQQLDGMQSGTYELEVKVLSSTGYWETFKTPLAIKYDNQIIQ